MEKSKIADPDDYWNRPPEDVIEGLYRIIEDIKKTTRPGGPDPATAVFMHIQDHINSETIDKALLKDQLWLLYIAGMDLALEKLDLKKAPQRLM